MPTNATLDECQFSSVALATQQAEEGALLLLMQGRLVGVLAPVSPEVGDDPSVRPGWYLMAGFGPCEREGLIFATIQDAQAWVRDSVEAAWVAPAQTFKTDVFGVAGEKAGANE